MEVAKTKRSATTDVFDSSKTNLRNALVDIHDGRLKLPNFQRSWKWTDANIASLLESIAEGHPIGAVMFLEVGGEAQFEHRCVEGSEGTAAGNMNPTQLIMDGQQRLTSLYQTLMSDAPVAMRSGRRDQHRIYLIDMEKAISAEHAISEAILSVLVDASGRCLSKQGPNYADPQFQYEHKLFPLSQAFDVRAWQMGYNSFWNERLIQERYLAQGMLTDFQQIVLTAFTSCMLPIITLRRGMSVESICRVYEKLNSKGIPLDAFDLLIAQFASRGFNLRECWQSVQFEKISKGSKGMLSDLSPKQYLQAVSMIAGLNQGKNVLGTQRKDILALGHDSYIAIRDSATKGFLAAYRFMLRQKIFSKRDIPAMYIVTALASILGHLGDKAEEHDVLARLERWFWSLHYTNSYAVGSDMAMAGDVPEVVRWLKGYEKEPRSMVNAFVLDAKITNATRKSASHLQSAVGTRLLRSGAADFFSGEAVTGHIYAEDRYDLHHIFPAKWCKDQGIPVERWDSIVNKTPMSAKTNKKMGGSAPSVYLRQIQDQAKVDDARMDEILRTHGIDSAHLRADNFDAFFAARSQFIFDQVERDIGKPVTRASDTDLPEENETGEDSWIESADMRLAHRGLVAYASLRDGNVVVLPGSEIAGSQNPSLVATYSEQRRQIIESDCVQPNGGGNWIVIKEIEFSSPSGAASICSGITKGPSAWRDRDGMPWSW